jgi:peptidoglycan hydrolase CwlO-like protein
MPKEDYNELKTSIQVLLVHSEYIRKSVDETKISVKEMQQEMGKQNNRINKVENRVSNVNIGQTILTILVGAISSFFGVRR